MQTEHIPMANSWFAKWRARTRMIRKWNNNKKVTYEDMRVMFNPDTTKIHDLEFILHVFGEHDGSPKNVKEKMLFDILFQRYVTEITHIAQMMRYPELEKLKIASPRKRLNPLYIAYKQRWLGVNKVKDFEKVFHGVTLDEYQKIVNKQYEFLDKKPQAKSKKKSTNKETRKRIDNLILSITKQK